MFRDHVDFYNTALNSHFDGSGLGDIFSDVSGNRKPSPKERIKQAKQAMQNLSPEERRKRANAKIARKYNAKKYTFTGDILTLSPIKRRGGSTVTLKNGDAVEILIPKRRRKHKRVVVRFGGKFYWLKMSDLSKFKIGDAAKTGKIMSPKAIGSAKSSIEGNENYQDFDNYEEDEEIFASIEGYDLSDFSHADGDEAAPAKDAAPQKLPIAQAGVVTSGLGLAGIMLLGSILWAASTVGKK